jgi:hypothetical protein
VWADTNGTLRVIQGGIQGEYRREYREVITNNGIIGGTQMEYRREH